MYNNTYTNTEFGAVSNAPCTCIMDTTIIIIILDYYVATLNVVCFCLTVNGRMFKVLKELDTTNAC